MQQRKMYGGLSRNVTTSIELWGLQWNCDGLSGIVTASKAPKDAHKSHKWVQMDPISNGV